MKFAATTNGSDLSVALRARGLSLVPNMIDAMNKESIGLASYIVENKLSGQVLNRRSGKLIASTQPIPAYMDGTSIKAGVESAGGEAWYGKIHEFGGIFTYLRPKRKHGFGTYTTLHFAERSFMRSSASEQGEGIIDRLSAVMKQQVEGA